MQPSLQKQNRYGWIDVAKGIAIILVVYRHVFEGLSRANLGTESFPILEDANIMFFSFRMPLFFMISGIFVASSLAKRGIGWFAFNKTGTILYPFLLWGCLQITLQFIMSKYTNADRSWISYFDLLVRPRRIDQFWYLYALFNVSMLFALLSHWFKLQAWQHVLLGVALYAASGAITVYRIETGFVYDILHYYIFMALGSWIAQYIFRPEVEVWVKKTWVLLLLLPLFLYANYQFLIINNSHGSANHIEYYQPALYFIIAEIGGIFMLILSMQLNGTSVGKLFASIGRYSLQIYVMHVLVASLVRTVFSKIIGYTYVPVLLFVCITLGMFIPMLVASIAQKKNWHWIFQWSFEKKPSTKMAVQ